MTDTETTALSLIKVKLEALHNQLLNGDESSSATAKEIVEALRTDVRPHERPLAASLTLQSEFSLLQFLRESVKHESRKNHSDARSIILDYIVRLVNENRQVRPLSAIHAAAIREAAFYCYRREELNKLRVLSLSAIAGVVRMKDSNLKPEQLAVRDMAAGLLKDLTGSKSKTSATLRAQIYRSLGLFAERFPERMFDKASQLRQIFIDVLAGKAYTAKTERVIIAGTLDGLGSLLVHFSGDFMADANNVKLLYKFVCIALTPDPNSGRYGIPRAALRLIRNHGALLNRYLTEDSENAYDRLMHWCCHLNPKMRSCAFPALDYFFELVAEEVVGDERPRTANKKTTEFFVGRFLRTLDARGSTMHEISASICGLGRFAPALKVFSRPGELSSLLNRLLVLGAQQYSGEPEQLDDTLNHMPTLLGAVSNVVDALGSVPPGAFALLESIVGTAFAIFRHTHPHHHPRHCRAINRLLLSLQRCEGALNSLLPKIVYQALILSCAGLERPVPGAAEHARRAHAAAAATAAHNSGLGGAEIEMVRHTFDEEGDELAEAAAADAADADLLLDERGDEIDESADVFDAPAARLVPGYRAYRPLWRAMLRGEWLSKAERAQAGRDARLQVSNAIYDALLGGVLRILSRLDVAYTIADSETGETKAAGALAAQHAANATPTVPSASDSDATRSSRRRSRTNNAAAAATTTSTTSAAVGGSSGNAMSRGNGDAIAASRALQAAASNPQQLHAAQANDMRLFLNLVRFCEGLLPNTLPHMFASRWVYAYCQRVIELSNRFPLLSGFYRLLTVAMHICERTNYFQSKQNLGAPLFEKQTVAFDEPDDVSVGAGADGMDDDDNDDDYARQDAERVYDAVDAMDEDSHELRDGALDSADEDNDGLDGDVVAGAAGGGGGGSDRARGTAGAEQRQYALDSVSLALLSKFVREVAARLRQFKNELLAACVRMVLAVPRALVDVPLLVPALDTALRLGVGYLPLARVGLDALERWLDTRPRTVSPFLPRVLPRLHRYLMADAPEEQDVANMEAEEVKARRLAQRVARRKHTIVETADESNPVYGLQLRVIRLLGQLGGRASALIGADSVDLTSGESDDVNDDSDAMKTSGSGSGADDGAALIAWDTERRVHFSMQLKDSTHQIYFDPILPRVLALAEGAADRRTKVAACELLHAIVLLMVGRNANARRSPQQYQLLYAKIFPALLRLAVDVDFVTRQLFEPLVRQLTHWFSKGGAGDKNSDSQEHADTVALVTSLLDAVGHADDGALREFGADCLAEFLHWYIKQSNDVMLQKSAVHAKSLFKRLVVMAQHPRATRRLGCALAINKLYRVLRECSPLVDRFLLELLVAVLAALRTAHDDAPTLGSIAQLQLSARHLGKIALRWAHMLRDENDQRRGACKDLAQFVEYLFDECALIEPASRREAQRLFMGLASHTRDAKSATDWLRQRVRSDGLDVVMSKFAAPPFPARWFEAVPELVSRRQLALLAHLDNIYFLVAHHLFDAYVLLLCDHADMAKTVGNNDGDDDDSSATEDDALLSSRSRKSKKKTFLNEAADWVASANEARLAFERQAPTPFEQSQFESMHQDVLCGLIGVLVLLWESYGDSFAEPVQQFVSNEKFWNLVLRCLLLPSPRAEADEQQENEPDKAALATKQQAVAEQKKRNSKSGKTQEKKDESPTDDQRYLPALLTPPSLNQSIRQLLRLTCTSAPSTAYKTLQKALINVLQSPKTDPMLIDVAAPNSHHRTTFALVAGYRELHKCKVLVDALPATVVKTAPDLAHFLLDSAVKAVQKHERLPPLASALGGALVRFALELGLTQEPLDKVVGDVESSVSPGPLAVDHAARASRASKSATTTTTTTKSSASSTTVAWRFYDSFAPALHGAMLAQPNGVVPGAYLQLMPKLSVARRAISDGLASTLSVESKVAMRARRKLVQRVCEHVEPLLALVVAAKDGDDDDAALRDDVLLLSQRLLSADARAVMTHERGAQFIVRLFETLLARDRPMAVKSRALSLLAGAVRYLPAGDSRLNAMCAAVNSLIVNSLPISSTDLAKGSAMYAEFIQCIDRLLSTLVASRSVRLLKELFPLLREGNEHVHAAAIDDAMLAFVARLNDDVARDAFNQCVAAASDAAKPSKLRIALTRKLCVPLFAHLKPPTRAIVATAHIEQLMQAATKAVSDVRGLAASVLLTTKMVAFDLLGAFFRRLTKKTLSDKVAPAYSGGKLISNMLRFAHAAIHEPVTIKDDSSSSTTRAGPDRFDVLKFRASAYSCLASAIVRTQTNPDFARVFFFASKPKDNQYPWERVVDTETPIEFKVETDFPKKSWNSLIAADNIDAAAVRRVRSALGGTGSRRDIRYISSAYLAATSLSHDLSQMGGGFMGLDDIVASMADDDDNNNIIDDNDIDDDKNDKDANDKAKEGKKASEEDEDPDAFASTAASASMRQRHQFFELDFFNSNACMLPLLRLIDALESNAARPPSRVPSTESKSMPAWMELMLHRLSPGSGPGGSDTHATIQMFIAKVVLNRPEVFAPHGQHWLRPLMRLGYRESALGRRGAGIHYFLRDLTFLLIDWANRYGVRPGALAAKLKESDHAINRDELRAAERSAKDERRSASQFVTHLMRESCGDRPSVIRGNVRLIQQLFEAWQGQISTPPRNVVVEFLSAGNQRSKGTKSTSLDSAKIRRQQTTGLQLLSVLIAHNYTPYDTTADPEDVNAVSPTRFFAALQSLLNGHHKEVYCAAAECAGMLVAQGTRSPNPHTKNFELDLRAHIMKFFTSRQLERALQCTAKLARFCGAAYLCEGFLAQVCDVLPRLVGEFRVIALQSVAQAAEQADATLFQRLRPLLRKLLTERSDDVQLLTLTTLYRMRGRLTLKNLSFCLPIMCALFPNHRHLPCREVFYQMAQWAWDTHELFPQSQRNLEAARDRGNTGSGDTTTTAMTANERNALLPTSSTMHGASLTPPPSSLPTPNSGTLPTNSISIVSGAAAASGGGAAGAAAASSSSLPAYVVSQLRVALLASLTDRSQVLAEKAFEFWSHESRIPLQTRARMAETLNTLWSPQTEDGWLSYSTRLLLLLARLSPVYDDRKNPLCSPLDAAVKEPIAIDTNPGHMTNQMVPLFQPTFAGGSGGTQASLSASLAPAARMPHGELQATAAPLFSLTLDQGADMTIGAGFMQSSASLDLTATGTSDTAGATSPQRRREWHYQNRTVTSPNRGSASQASQSASVSSGSVVALPPRRFRHMDINSATARGVARAAYQRRRKQAWTQRMKTARQAQVNVLRAYRAGDLPDVAIVPRDIVEPLQALVHLDSVTARHLYAELFATVIGDQDTAATNNLLRQRLDEMLRTTRGGSSFVGSVLLLCHRHPQLAPSPRVVGSAAVRSLNYQAGILALESVLLACGSDGHAAALSSGKRRRAASLTRAVQARVSSVEERQAWKELAVLYNELGERDVRSGLLLAHIATLDETKQALKAAMSGDHARAASLYNRARVSHKQSGDGAVKKEKLSPSRRSGSKRRRGAVEETPDDPALPSREERALWDTELLAELTALGKWKNVNQLVSSDDPESLLRPAGRPSINAHAWTRVAVRDRSKWPDLWSAVAHLTSVRRTELESSWMPVELALIAVAQNDFERAEFVVRAFRRSFLAVWPRFHPLARAARRVYLRRLQPVHEIEEYLALARAIGSAQARTVDEATAAAAAAVGGLGDELRDAAEPRVGITTTPVDAHRALQLHRQLLRRWRARLPALADGALAWDDVATVRDVLLQKLAEQAHSRTIARDDDDDVDDAAAAFGVDGEMVGEGASARRAEQRRQWTSVENAVRRERTNQLLLVTRGALRQGNAFGADAYLKRYLNIGDDRDANRISAVRLLVKTFMAKATVEFEYNVDKGLEKYVHALQFTQSHLKDAPESHKGAFLRMRAEICQPLYAVAEKHNVTIAKLLAGNRLALECLGGASRSTLHHRDVVPLIAEAGVDALARAVELSEPDKRATPSIHSLRLMISRRKAFGGDGGVGNNAVVEDDTDNGDVEDDEERQRVEAASSTWSDDDDADDDDDDDALFGNVADESFGALRTDDDDDDGDDASKRKRRIAERRQRVVDTRRELVAVERAARSQLELATFADRVLQKLEAKAALDSRSCSDDELCVGERQLPVIFVEGVLGAMRLGNATAGDLVPRVLDLTSRYWKLCSKKFAKLSALVPAWRYVRWVGQLMPRLDSPHGVGAAVGAVLARVLREWPQQVFFAFNMTRSTLDASAAPVKQLTSLLKSPSLETFIHECRRMTHPELRMKDWVAETRIWMASKTPRTEQQAKERYAALMDILNNVESKAGKYNAMYAKYMRKRAFALLGHDHTKLLEITPDTFHKETKPVMKKRKQVKGFQVIVLGHSSGKALLSDFSPYLVDFGKKQAQVDADEDVMARGVVVPGALDAFAVAPPSVAPPTIVSFDPEILVMSSIRKPKRVRLYGDDAVRRSFLVKGGEDLRMDERVSGLFALMNAVFARDSRCGADVRVRNYHVTPMAPDVGLIEWVEDTRTIKEAMSAQVGARARDGKPPFALRTDIRDDVRDGKKLPTLDHLHACQLYKQLVEKFGLDNSAYRHMFEACAKDPDKHLHNVKLDFDQARDAVPWDLLHSVIVSLTPSPEAFLSLRSTFATSLATFNVCGWVLGIGDRHIENALLSHRDGRLVPIDFGHAFGSATQFLAVPELSPMRLTRQFEGVLRPLGNNALLAPTMVSAMRALHESRDVLMRALDVFVRDPISDWVSLARRLAGEQLEATKAAANEATAAGVLALPDDTMMQRDHADGLSAHARARLKSALLKLDMYSPGHTVKLDLKMSVMAKASPLALDGACIVVDRAGGGDGRCASIEEQVERLISMSTSSELLGHAYNGWQSYV